MDIKSLVKKYSLKSNIKGFESLNYNWFKNDEFFRLDNVDNFKEDLRSYLIEGFEGIFDFLYDKKDFSYSVKFYMNLFKILNELESSENLLKIINELENILSMVKNLKDDDEWDDVEDRLNYIKYDLLNNI